MSNGFHLIWWIQIVNMICQYGQTVNNLLTLNCIFVNFCAHSRCRLSTIDEDPAPIATAKDLSLYQNRKTSNLSKVTEEEWNGVAEDGIAGRGRTKCGQSDRIRRLTE